MSDASVVSCLCVTRNRVQKLRRAISCFLAQTYPHRELLIVYESDDVATGNYLAMLNEPLIRPFEVASSPKMSLGALRNISMEAGRGHYMAQWDDDDWHGPTRLAEQMHAIGESGKRACVLVRWLVYDEETQTAYLSGRRAWEGSLLGLRAAVPRYADLVKGEDTSTVRKMLSENALAGLDRPDLYIYTFHGGNTWDRSHWQANILPYAEPLSHENQEWVKAALLGQVDERNQPSNN